VSLQKREDPNERDVTAAERTDLNRARKVAYQACGQGRELREALIASGVLVPLEAQSPDELRMTLAALARGLSTHPRTIAAAERRLFELTGGL
jgi:hypothetical protein